MKKGAQPPSLAIGLFLMSILAVTCSGQGVSVKYQNQFQCWPGVQLTGLPLPVNGTVQADSPDDCAKKCMATPGCTLFTLSRTSLLCNMKYLPFDSTFGSTRPDVTVVTSCVLKAVGGSLPSPADTMCYPGQDIAGNLIGTTGSVSSATACATLCVATPGCSYSVFRPHGINGTAGPACALKSNAFAGSELNSTTRKDPTVTGLCMRAIPAPQIMDPMLALAGAIPFLIKTKGSNLCLRAISSLYYSGQSVVFSSNCTSGSEPLWTYNANTQIITHWASGLCLAPAGYNNGVALIMSSDCGPTSGNRIVSRGSGSLMVLLGSRMLVPALATLCEGAAVEAVTNTSQLYSFIPAPGQAYECFPGMDITGTSEHTYPNTISSDACAALCVSNCRCTFFTYGTDKTCYLRYNPFTQGEATLSNQSAMACLSRGPPSGALPSPANYLCYSNQRVSGTILSSTASDNPMKCTDMCTATPNCTYSLYSFDGTCTLGTNAFHGTQGNDQNKVDYEVIQLCLHAQGAPDTILRGYACFNNASVNGDVVATYSQVASAGKCIRLCESASEICTLAVYTASSQLCLLKNNAFAWGGQASIVAGETSCLRSASGGSKNSPANFLCYGNQNVAGTVITRQAGVADTTTCASLCGTTPGCTVATYLPVEAATCVLKKQPFSGSEGSAYNTADPSVGAVCLAAPGAPEVLSSFGVDYPPAGSIPDF